MNETSRPRKEPLDIIGHVRRRLERARQDHRARGTPVTTLAYAQSLDGCIAGKGGRTLQLSSPESMRMTHRLRAMHRAILVGVHTVLSDDPRLNVRLVDGDDPQPVVVDSGLRFPLRSRLLRDPCVRPIIAAGEDACQRKEKRLVDAGVQVIRLPQRKDGLLDLRNVLQRLRQMGFDTVMVEGGAKIITSVLASGLADQIVLTISPIFVGGLSSVGALEATTGGRLPRLVDLHYESLGGDLVIRGDLEC